MTAKTKIWLRSWIICHCNQCVKKKWSRYQKKTSPRLKLAFIGVLIAFLVIDSIATWYDKTWNEDRWTFINETNAETVETLSNGQAILTDAKQGHNEIPVSVQVETKTERGDYPSPQVEVIKKVAEKEGIDWKILYAICKKESNCTANRVGDGGRSFGAFQIHTGYHPSITWEQATDLEWAAEWTAKRLKRHAHLGEYTMIRSHNGLVKNNANAYYVEDIYRIMNTL